MNENKDILVADSGQTLIELDKAPEGKVAWVMPTKLLVLPPEFVKQQRINLKLAAHYQTHFVSKDLVKQGVDPETYHGAKRGVAFFCADIVVTTYLPNGEAAVAYIMRREDGFLGGVWWVQGGVNFTLKNPEDQVREKAKEELGVAPIVETCMGVWITSGIDKNPPDQPDKPYAATTGQVCYVGYAPFDKIRANIGYDEDHVGLCLFTRQDLVVNIPSEERHSYPVEAGLLALDSMPHKNHYKT